MFGEIRGENKGGSTNQNLPPIQLILLPHRLLIRTRRIRSAHGPAPLDIQTVEINPRAMPVEIPPTPPHR